MLVNSAYLAPPYQVAAIGPSDLYDVLVTAPGFVELVQARADRYGIRISFAEPDRVTVPAYAGTVTLRYARPPAPSPHARALTMRQPRSQIALTAVALLLGLLVVVQLRAQQAGTGLETQSSQDLTLLIANVTTRNDQLRGEVADIQRQLDTIAAANARGETSVGQLRTDLERVRIWSGEDPATGPGIRVLLFGGVPAGGGLRPRQRAAQCRRGGDLDRRGARGRRDGRGGIRRERSRSRARPSGRGSRSSRSGTPRR